MGPPPPLLKLSQISHFWLNCVLQCPHGRKKIKNLSIDFIWLNNDQNRCQKWPFSLISPSISDFVLKILKPCKGNQVKFIYFFWSFRHKTTFLSQEIWNLIENEAVKGWVHIQSQQKEDHWQLAMFKQGTPTSLAPIVSNFQFFDSNG